MQVAAIMAVSLLLLGFNPRLGIIPTDYKILLVLLGIIIIATLSPPIFNRLLALGFRLFKKRRAPAELHVNGKAVIRAFSLYAIGTFIQGLSGFFIVRALAPQAGLHDLIFIIGAFNLAGVIGIIAIFAPSGLGVREGVLLLLLSLIMPKELALVVVVASRLWSALVDVLFYLLSELFYRIKPTGEIHA
jgi:uncharacterized membrane protein YbhN (UPF0104 family)